MSTGYPTISSPRLEVLRSTLRYRHLDELIRKDAHNFVLKYHLSRFGEGVATGAGHASQRRTEVALQPMLNIPNAWGSNGTTDVGIGT